MLSRNCRRYLLTLKRITVLVFAALRAVPQGFGARVPRRDNVFITHNDVAIKMQVEHASQCVGRYVRAVFRVRIGELRGKPAA